MTITGKAADTELGKAVNELAVRPQFIPRAPAPRVSDGSRRRDRRAEVIKTRKELRRAIRPKG